MGILDWFKNRTGYFDPDRASGELVRWATDRALMLTNPQLGLLSNSARQLAPAIETTIQFLRSQVSLLPSVHTLAPKNWSADPALRAFFVKPADVSAVLGGSDNLRTLFSKYPELDEACVVLGMAFKEQRVLGMSLQGEIVQRDVAQTTVSFSDHRARICDRDEIRLRRVIGIEILEYLVSQALAEIGAERAEKQELQRDRSLMRARLRLLQQHGPGLGSMFGAAPAVPAEQARLDAELLENERQLQAMGGSDAALQSELDCLISVLGNPQRYLHFRPQRLRLDAMNRVVEAVSSDQAADVDFTVIELTGSQPLRRGFILGRVARAELPLPAKPDFAKAAGYL